MSLKLPTVPGTHVRTREEEIWRDEADRLVALRRIDRLTRAQLQDIVERVRNTLWMRMRNTEGDEEAEEQSAINPEVPDVDEGGVGGADAVDLILEVLDGYDLNPKVMQTA